MPREYRIRNDAIRLNAEGTGAEIHVAATAPTPGTAVALWLDSNAADPASAAYITRDTGTTWVALSSTADYETFAEFFEDFQGMADTEVDHNFILNSGTDAQALDPVHVPGYPTGVWKLTTGDADGTVAADGSQLVWSDRPIKLANAGGVTEVEAKLRINTAITDVSLFFGLTDSTALEEAFTNSADTITAVATDACGFLYDTDATTDTWWMCAVDTGTSDAGDAALATAPVADTYQTLKMIISSDGATISFYIDGTLAGAMSGDVGVGDDVTLYPTICACSTTTTSKVAFVDWMRVKVTR
jgi:hypothetical protein